ncbi:hypothetical protein L249_7397 [Ophiocordyceps polyrhachis-furcata BCC 54312]|uniref:Protein YTP1-like C-terminal domain-containing protein n=1 Tax=Ophiocordyceps polyrhachis-furcata BCC 54312 TaxID=1330021 RepID=A0A367LA74_9HYPO|nr:hypothetical protein L249_7397 [Ophiocordyceps polyrhachis-furcata BCC 54312]
MKTAFAYSHPLFGIFAILFVSAQPSLAHETGYSTTIGVINPASDNATQSYPASYFTHSQYVGLIYAHIFLMLVSWALVLPIAVMLSLAGSRFTLVSQYWFLSLNALALVFGTIYNAKTPDLYPNNAHGKVGWLISWVASAQVLLSLLGWAGGIVRSGPNSPSSGRLISDYSHLDCDIAGIDRFSSDSNQGAGSSSKVLPRPLVPALPDGNYEAIPAHSSDEEVDNVTSNQPVFVPLTLTGVKGVFIKAYQMCALLYRVIDRILLPGGFVAFATGVATFGRLFGTAIFSGLAHWIKGGVFFWLGLLTLGRWAGCFGELGWAWNMPPHTSRRTWRPSAEWTESALIFVYGSTNIFLEHLGRWGRTWSAQDLQHIAITVLFIGGGLERELTELCKCGMLIESTKIRNLLHTSVLHAMLRDTQPAGDGERQPTDDGERQQQQLPPSTHVFSLNPMPALVILLLGIIMSSHQQSAGIAMEVHRQWGLLLSGASFARCLTYILVFLRPPKSILPSRPPTELLTAFGLLAGGIIFMASSSDTIDVLNYYHLDAMFTYTVTMGLDGLVK